MESLASTTSTASRDVLAEELTNLRSLLRLNADGIGEEADLISQLNQSGTPFPNAPENIPTHVMNSFCTKDTKSNANTVHVGSLERGLR